MTPLSTPRCSLGAEPFGEPRYDYMNEAVGFWRSLWLVLKGHRLREYVTYKVTEDLDSEGGLREVWVRE